MTHTITLSVKDLESAQTLNPNQTIPVPANVNGTILMANNGTTLEPAKYKLTISGQTTSGEIPANGSKLVTYSSAQAGTLQNTGSVSFEVSF